jgi:GNAT superfamily N-acetyltransferase
VADIQGELVGYTYGQRADFGAYDCELVALHVREIYQRKGIGSRLIRELAQTFVDLACKALFLWVLSENPVIELYTRPGGKLIGKKTWGNNQYFEGDVEETAIGWSDKKILLD